MPNETALYEVTNRVLDGQLPNLLIRWAHAGASRRVAAKLLEAELDGIWINPTTVQRWTASLLVEPEA